jgi:hypothetical protein
MNPSNITLECTLLLSRMGRENQLESKGRHTGVDNFMIFPITPTPKASIM